MITLSFAIFYFISLTTYAACVPVVVSLYLVHGRRIFDNPAIVYQVPSYMYCLSTIINGLFILILVEKFGPGWLVYYDLIMLVIMKYYSSSCQHIDYRIYLMGLGVILTLLH
jgi:hypothetical protein